MSHKGTAGKLPEVPTAASAERNVHSPLRSAGNSSLGNFPFPGRQSSQNDGQHLIHQTVSPPIRGNPQLMMLEEVYFRARSKFEEYQLPPSLALLSRGQHEKAARIYYALYTVIQSSISSSQADKMERYIREKAPMFPNSMFNLADWEIPLKVARIVRTHELKDARMELYEKRKELGRHLLKASAALKTITTEVAEFKSVVSRDVANLGLFFKNVQILLLSTIGAFSAKQAGVIRSLETALATAQSKTHLEHERVVELEALCSTQAETIESMSHERVALQRRVDELKGLERHLTNRADELATHVTEATKKGNKAVREVTAQLHAVESDLANMQAHLTTVQEELSGKHAALEKATTWQQSTQRQLDKREAAIKLLKEQVTSLQQETKDSVTELTQVRSSLSISQKSSSAEHLVLEQTFKAREAALRSEGELNVKKERALAKMTADGQQAEQQAALQELMRQLSEEK